MEEILVTGANRGLGLELARQSLERGNRVFAASRHPGDPLAALAEKWGERLVRVPLDVTDESSLARAIDLVREHTERLDVLVNNAGVMPRHEQPGNLTAATLLETFHVNSVAPILVAQACLPLLERAERPRIINVTSELGSLNRKHTGGFYAYCASKAALNMLSQALAFDLEPRGIIVIALHPGWVQTDMGGARAPLTAQESVQGILRLVDGLTRGESGRFLSWQDEVIPW